MFNKTKKAIIKDQMDEHKKRVAECVPIAKEILRLIGTEEVAIGDINDKDGNTLEETAKTYVSLTGKILNMMLEKNMRFYDKNYVFQLVKQAYSQVEERVLDSFNMNYDAMLSKYFGKDTMDITMEDLDKKLKETLEVA